MNVRMKCIVARLQLAEHKACAAVVVCVVVCRVSFVSVCERTIHTSNAHMNEMMKSIAAQLHLAEHKACAAVVWCVVVRRSHLFCLVLLFVALLLVAVHCAHLFVV